MGIKPVYISRPQPPDCLWLPLRGAPMTPDDLRHLINTSSASKGKSE